MVGHSDTIAAAPHAAPTATKGAGAHRRGPSGNTPEHALRVRPERLAEAPKRVVIADDDPVLVEDMLHRVRSLDIDIASTAADGEHAILECREHLPDLAIFDLRMPRLDGATAATTVFTELAIPVVIVSAHAEPDDVARASAAGVFGYLVKPVSTRQVRASIEVAWQRYTEHVRTHWEVASLRTRLEQRKAIERAKWLLVEHRGLSEPQALRQLQQTARAQRSPLIHVANDVLEEFEAAERNAQSD